ncbi:MAG: hypothetical protein GY811_25360 [Myxococcales bacterium]|nr:hypothetical protein [Myxococcales bacterium]
MSTNSLRRTLRLVSISAAFLVGLLGLQSTADAQRARPAKVKPAKVAAAKRGAAKLRGTEAFKPTTVSAGLKASLRGKPLMVAPKAKTGEYARAMKNSVEIMFMPHASSYGHLLVRVGDRMYDMPGPSGARNQNFSDAMRWVNSAGYGFVYARTSQQIAKLKQKFETFANAGHGFSMAGSGPTNFSCAGFVTAALKEHAPELKVGLSVGAIGAARRLLNSGSHDAVTLYGNAAGEAGNADFKFLKLQ